MKKNYINPSVEIESAMFASQAICTSPTGIGAGTGSGTTGDIGGGSEPIPGS